MICRRQIQTILAFGSNKRCLNNMTRLIRTLSMAPPVLPYRFDCIVTIELNATTYLLVERLLKICQSGY